MSFEFWYCFKLSVFLVVAFLLAFCVVAFAVTFIFVVVFVVTILVFVCVCLLLLVVFFFARAFMCVFHLLTIRVAYCAHVLPLVFSFDDDHPFLTLAVLPVEMTSSAFL